MRLPWAFLSRPKASGSRAEDGREGSGGPWGKGWGTTLSWGPHSGSHPILTIDAKTRDPQALFYRWETDSVGEVSSSSMYCQSSTPSVPSQQAGQVGPEGRARDLEQCLCRPSIQQKDATSHLQYPMA